MAVAASSTTFSREGSLAIVLVVGVGRGRGGVALRGVA
jgi:hypothetical protein